MPKVSEVTMTFFTVISDDNPFNPEEFFSNPRETRQEMLLSYEIKEGSVRARVLPLETYLDEQKASISQIEQAHQYMLEVGDDFWFTDIDEEPEENW